MLLGPWAADAKTRLGRIVEGHEVHTAEIYGSESDPKNALLEDNTLKKFAINSLSKS